MSQAIVTKYLGPTNTKGARVCASAFAGSVIVPWEHSQDGEQNHRYAAQTLAAKLGWLGPSLLVGGTIKGGGFAWVLVANDCQDCQGPDGYRARGWAVFNAEGDDPGEVQRCDTCRTFPDDESAAVAAAATGCNPGPRPSSLVPGDLRCPDCRGDGCDTCSKGGR